MFDFGPQNPLPCTNSIPKPATTLKLFRGGPNNAATLPPTYYTGRSLTEGPLPFSLAWFTTEYSLAETYGPVHEYIVTLHNIKDVTPEEWRAFDRVMVFADPQPVIDLKAQG